MAASRGEVEPVEDVPVPVTGEPEVVPKGSPA
jgi:hypothetical protein